MTEYKFKCNYCGMIITAATSTPDRKMGGPCPRDSSGNHYYSRV